jgi:hypothetical protein
MPYEIIEITNEELENTPVLEAIDARLKAALSTPARIVPLKLRPEMDDCSMGLEWLEQWSRHFMQAGKTLVTIPATRYQHQCLEISHPDQNLRYVESVDELEKAYPELVEPVAPPAVPESTAESGAVEQQRGIVPPPQSASPSLTPPPPVQGYAGTHDTGGAEFETPTPYEEMMPGTISEVSGEYACKSCGNHRMWLKGDLVTACTEMECLDPERGWKLSCDLF